MSYYKDMHVVYKTQNRLMSESIAAFLEAQGIKTIVDQDAAGSIYGFTVGKIGEVYILVHESQVEKAHELLKAMEAGEFEDTEFIEPIQENLETEDEQKNE